MLAACAYAGVFGVFILLETPGLGIGHFFYLPVCLVALATDALGGALAGLFAASLYALALVVDPRIPSRDALTHTTGIRALTFASVGALVGLYAARNRALVDGLREHASRDFVTGVANVRAFDQELERRCADRARFALVLVDVNGLRRVNDVHGHTAGDAALRRVATALGDLTGDSDLIARVGGDEFAILAELTPEEIPAFAARLNAALGPDELSVTAAATFAPDDGEAAVDLFRKADDRLFAAKLVRMNRAALAAV
jgi:diguanylate cyclase (GGDEF)-like protein